ncbi:Hydrolase, alpha/beta fold family protein [Minicystis rosea]|nr:Hydrolase, alpha/beta fold family protein [Minicystis rosea]
MLSKLARGFSIAAAGSAGSALLLRRIAQRSRAVAARIPEGGIDEAGFVELDGLEQWVAVRGHDRAAPVLLFLHGGPGAAMSLLAYRQLASWEQQLTVVIWDQRGAGRTFGRHGRASLLTFDRIVADGLALAEHLRARLGRRRIVLLGHSWGSMLGVEMIRRRPDLFCAYVGTGQVVDVARGESMSHAATLARLRARGDDAGAAELERIGPPPYPSREDLRTQRRLLVSTMPEAERRIVTERTETLLLAPGGTLKDVADFYRGFAHSIDTLWPSILSFRLDPGMELGVPAFFFTGEEDLQTPAALVAEYAPTLRAPKRAVVMIPGAAHFAYATHGDVFLRELVARVRPLAADA